MTIVASFQSNVCIGTLHIETIAFRLEFVFITLLNNEVQIEHTNRLISTVHPAPLLRVGWRISQSCRSPGSAACHRDPDTGEAGAQEALALLEDGGGFKTGAGPRADLESRT